MIVAKDHNKWIIFYLAALVAFGPFSIDLYLAALPTIKQHFNASASDTQLTLASFFFGFALAQLFWGPLSDRLGRKPVIFIGLLVYFLSTAICYESPDIFTLTVGRLFQGVGGTCALVMSIAMVKDIYSNHDAIKIFPLIYSIMSIAPIIAPVIGSHLLTWFGWRSCFLFLLAYDLTLVLVTIIVLPESYPVAKRRPLPIRRIAAEYRLQLTYLPFLCIALVRDSHINA